MTANYATLNRQSTPVPFKTLASIGATTTALLTHAPTLGRRVIWAIGLVVECSTGLDFATSTTLAEFAWHKATLGFANRHQPGRQCPA